MTKQEIKERITQLIDVLENGSLSDIRRYELQHELKDMRWKLRNKWY